MPLDGDRRTRIAIAFEKERLHCFDIPPGAAVESPLMWKWAAAQAAPPLGKDCHPPRHDGGRDEQRDKIETDQFCFPGVKVSCLSMNIAAPSAAIATRRFSHSVPSWIQCARSAVARWSGR